MLLKPVKTFLRATAFLLIPFIILVVLGYLNIPYTKLYLKEVIAFGLLTFVFMGLLSLIKANTLRKGFLLLSYGVLSLLCFVKLGFYNQYDAQLNASSLYVIFETNTEEVSEYISHYTNPTLIGLLLLLLCSLFLVFKYRKNIMYASVSKTFKGITIIGIICALFLIQWKFIDENIPLMSMQAYKEYKETKAILKGQLAQKETHYFEDINAKEGPQTYVVIIGESTSRRHLELYGYPRPTNPLLSQIREDLFIFDSVITPNVHTILSLDKILSFSTHKTPNKKENASMVQLANKAGFTSYWISNQRPVGFHESIPTLIGAAAHKRYYTTSNDYNEINYDEKVLPVLEKVLQEPEEKKMIFIHLIGTHIDYPKRYPPKFNHFKDAPLNRPFTHKLAIQRTNEYDNAVRYNDSIIATIIERVKSVNENSLVCYFSDHGDDVYDVLDQATHNEYHGTKPMYEVPFIIWLSKKYKQENSTSNLFSTYTNRRYNLEDFIHTFASLTNIQSKDIDRSRSILDSLYIQRPRIVKKNKDYDKE